MITPAYSLASTERVLPKVTIDFTNASLDSRITFTRALNTATRVNSSGYIESVSADTARFDYDPITLACKGLLIEEARENKLTYSSTFSNAIWSKREGSISTANVTSPGNDSTVDLFTENTATAQHEIRYSFAFTGSTTYTLSVFAKSNGRNLLLYVDGFSGGYIFNLANGTVGASVGTAPTSASITAYPNSWYRCSITLTWGTGSTSNIRFLLLNGTTNSYAGNGTSGAYFYGAQLEVGSFGTSYVPTTTTSLTRNADIATMTGTNFSNWWVATTGASVIWLTPKATATLAYLSFDDNTANNSIVIANSTTSGQSKITSGGVLQATLTAGTITANSTNKVTCSWNTNSCAATANAAAPATTASATIPTVTQLRLGSDGTAFANSWLRLFQYWPQRITNNETQAFSK